LIDRLKAGLGRGCRSTRTLTLISASAGFGKTTLVVEWLTDAGCPFAWLSLDEGDNDPARFVTYLIAALQGIDGEIGQATRGLFRSTPIPAVDLAITSLINDIAGVTEPFVLVLDDYHEIHEEWIHSAVAYLLAHQPPQLHLVLVTRTDPPLPLPRLRVRDQVTEVRAEDLRFTAQECSAFLDRTLGGPVDAETIAALTARTEGWIAALQLAALQLVALSPSTQGTDRDVIADFVAAFSGSHRHVIDYLAEEVLAQQPDEIRRFLRQTAVLDRLTAPLCDAVTGRGDSETILTELEQANLFLVPLDNRRTWYRYHALFRDYLRTELDPESRAALHAQAARWFWAQDLLPEAAQHALASADMELAAQVIALAAKGAFRSASIATLAGWLDALSEEAVQANAELATYKGFVLYLADRREEAAKYARLAQKSICTDALPAAKGRLYCLNAHVALCNDALDRAIQFSREALDALGEDDAFFRDLALNILGQALEQGGDTLAAADVYREAFRLRLETGNQLGTMVVLTNLAFALNELGQRREARELCQQIVAESTPRPKSGYSLTEGAYLAWSLLSLEADELSLAQEQAERALALCQQARILDGVWWATFILARVHLANGEIEAMRQVCHRVHHLEAHASQGLYQAWFAALEAQASMQVDGDLAAGERWAQAAALTADDVPHRWNEYLYFVYVRLLLATDRLKDAQNLLAVMEGSAEQSQRLRSLITIYLQQALVCQALGQGGRALARVEDALHLAVPQDYRRAFLDEGPLLLALLPRVRPRFATFVQDLLQDSPKEGPIAHGRGDGPSPPAEPLTERELDILRLIAAGRSNPEIAELLYLSLNTVKWHARNLYAKLDVGNRVQAAARAKELGLF
jgi:LuxR family maltose regulon positive regulatory protein